MNNAQIAHLLIQYLPAKPCSYSGRGMYGSSCLGFSYNSYQEYVQQSLEALYSALEDTSFEDTRTLELMNALSRFASDSLGRGLIIYFPQLECPNLLEDEDEDEKDEDED